MDKPSPDVALGDGVVINSDLSLQLNDIAIERYKAAESALTSARAAIADMASALEAIRNAEDALGFRRTISYEALDKHAAEIEKAIDPQRG